MGIVELSSGMQSLVKAVLVNIDSAGMQELINLKIEAEDILEEIRGDLEAVRPEISFWDRINVFRKTENELREESYRRELIDERQNLKLISEDIRTKVVSAIDRTYSVRLKLHLGRLMMQADALRSTGGSDGSSRKVKGKKKLLETLELVDEEHSTRFDFEPGPVKEEDLIQAITERLGV